MQNLRLTFLGLLFLLALPACQEDDATPECTILATVRDLTGLDGCGWVLELENGERLEPYLPYAITADPLWCGVASPDYNTTPWYDANPQDGMKVRIAYEVLDDRSSVCMVGDIVEVTCLEVLERPESDLPVR